VVFGRAPEAATGESPVSNTSDCNFNYSWWERGCTFNPQASTLIEVVQRQAPIAGGWICPMCKNHKGGVGCEANVFIAFVGANMSGCQLYDRGEPCIHCGRAT
jgi:hypothetical protein